MAKPEKSWEKRLSGKPHELAVDFVESLSYDHRLYKFDLIGSIAHARMLADAKLISEMEFETIQETPYTFHAPNEFSCRPNRGGTEAPLFQVNHWIETTPTPRPSNAEIVNEKEFLLARARRCQEERHRLTNILAVDFAMTGDVVGAAAELNGLN